MSKIIISFSITGISGIGGEAMELSLVWHLANSDQ